MSDGLCDDIRRLLEVMHPAEKHRAAGDALVLFRLFSGEGAGKLIAEYVRSTASTLPPPRAPESRPSPLPDTVDYKKRVP